MGIIKNHNGQLCYNISNNTISVLITIQGGHTTASFNIDNKFTDPFYYVPWWNEEPDKNFDKVLNILRGDFFCFPFGMNAEQYGSAKYPLHGQTSNEIWDFLKISEKNEEKEIQLRMYLMKNSGQVIKSIKIFENNPVMYENNIVSGFKGKIPLGYHPTIRLPDAKASAFLDFSKPIIGFTPPIPNEEPQKKGYSLLRHNQKITDITKVDTIYGNTIDISKCPFCRGFDDIIIFINDEKRHFCFTSLSFPNEGYLYFQLKNPKVFSETFIWMSNGGRYYPPWNGRVFNAIGLEEITAFFHYGIKQSVEDNSFKDNGYNTYLDLEGDKIHEFKIIKGLIPIDRDFKGVKDIIKKDTDIISILGKNNEVIDVKCNVDFLY